MFIGPPCQVTTQEVCDSWNDLASGTKGNNIGQRIRPKNL